MKTSLLAVSSKQDTGQPRSQTNAGANPEAAAFLSSSTESGRAIQTQARTEPSATLRSEVKIDGGQVTCKPIGEQQRVGPSTNGETFSGDSVPPAQFTLPCRGGDQHEEVEPKPGNGIVIPCSPATSTAFLTEEEADAWTERLLEERVRHDEHERVDPFDSYRRPGDLVWGGY